LASFIWTGGALGETKADPNDPNFAASNSTLNLNGNSTITLPTDGTLYCGDTMNIGTVVGQAGTAIVQGAGTLLVNGGQGMNILSKTLLPVNNVRDPAAPIPTLWDLQGRPITLS